MNNSVPRAWALWSAAALATAAAALHTFMQANPALDALAAGDIAAEGRQGLQMMWHGMTAIAWLFPVVILLLLRQPVRVARPVLAWIAVLSGAQAVLFAAAALWLEGGSWLPSVPVWALHAPIAVLAWLARPPRSSGTPAPQPRRTRPRLVIWWLAMILATFSAVLHTVLATLSGWPDALLASNTASGPRLTLYAMWLFSCVVFCAVPVALVWSRRAPAAPSRFVLRYLAIVVLVLAASWTTAVAFGSGSDLDAVGPVSLTLLATLTALSVPTLRRGE